MGEETLYRVFFAGAGRGRSYLRLSLRKSTFILRKSSFILIGGGSGSFGGGAVGGGGSGRNFFSTAASAWGTHCCAVVTASPIFVSGNFNSLSVRLPISASASRV